MMLTRCPHCATTFRVTPHQLKARQGKVRCGKCQAVFDALETLAEEAPAIIASPEGPEEQVPATTVPEVAPARVEPLPLTQDPLPEPSPDSEQPTIAEPEPEPETPPEPEALPVKEPARQPVPELALHEEEQPQRRSWPWLLGSLFPACLLAMQVAVHFRTELAVLAPEAKPVLAEFCEMVGCQLALPRKVDLIGIETSDLIPDKEKPDHLHLVATLRNRAPFAQVWPHLEVTLTDTNDRALLRRALAPAEYLPAKLSSAEGFPPNGEHIVQLALQATDIPAVGYRLYVFYP
jgi:predicted Zn finger-like uncharacterized protein